MICTDGSIGYPERMPYQAISVAAAAPDVPTQLLEQLAASGRLVIPAGAYDEQELRVVTRDGDKFSTRVAAHCRFVPLRGGEGWTVI